MFFICSHFIVLALKWIYFRVAIIYIYAFTLARYRVCLCNYTRPFGDVLCFRYRITDEEIARFCEMSDEEFSEPFEDDGGEDYVPPVNDEESDIEDVRLGERIPIEKEVEVDSDEEEDLLTEVENTTMPPLADVYHSPDSTVWNKTPLPSSQTRSYNIIRESGNSILSETVVEHKYFFSFMLIAGGPNRITTLYTRTDTFNALVTPEMKRIIIRESNRKANQVYYDFNKNSPSAPKLWKPITYEELDAFFGILLMAGVHKSNTEHIDELWKSDALPLYKATMSRDRFKQILRFIRFDNPTTRPARVGIDKAAAISDIWLILNRNLLRLYRANEHLTVDEQLFPYRGRTKFTQYIPSKPAKYGIKVFWVCDAITFYPCQGSIYTGRLAGNERRVNIGEKTVMSLCQHYKNSGRNITTDNFFTSLPLARALKSDGLTLVGTLRKNKPYIPKALLSNKERAALSTRFAFHRDAMLCSYVPKVNKAVILLSTMHSTDVIDDSLKKKPEVISFYNKTKSGVDVMDKMLGTYTCKRRTSRWPLAFFFNILDVASLAAYIIYSKNNPTSYRSTNKRRNFLKDLARDLCLPAVTQRSQNTIVLRNRFTKNAIESVLAVVLEVPHNSNPVIDRDSSGRISVKGICKMCYRGDDKLKRKTRKMCTICKNPVCLQHTDQTIHCLECQNK